MFKFWKPLNCFLYVNWQQLIGCDDVQFDFGCCCLGKRCLWTRWKLGAAYAFKNWLRCQGLYSRVLVCSVAPNLKSYVSFLVSWWSALRLLPYCFCPNFMSFTYLMISKMYTLHLETLQQPHSPVLISNVWNHSLFKRRVNGYTCSSFGCVFHSEKKKLEYFSYGHSRFIFGTEILQGRIWIGGAWF